MIDRKKNKKEIGRLSRASGKRFELSVREDLESRGWIVCKWTNTIEFDEEGEGKIIKAKSKYNPFLKRVISEGSGFPDYVAMRHDAIQLHLFDIIGIEAKKGKYLDKKEKQICTWLLDNNIFANIYIAHPVKDGRKIKIVYQKFER